MWVNSQEELEGTYTAGTKTVTVYWAKWKRWDGYVTCADRHPDVACRVYWTIRANVRLEDGTCFCVYEDKYYSAKKNAKARIDQLVSML